MALFLPQQESTEWLSPNNNTDTSNEALSRSWKIRPAAWSSSRHLL